MISLPTLQPGLLVRNPTPSSSSLVPIMTSDNAPLGNATASSEAIGGINNAWVAFSENNASNCWVAASGLPQWIQYQFTSPRKVTAFQQIGQGGITPGTNDAAQYALQASNDGTNFTTLFSASVYSALTASVSASNQGLYQYYRIYITAIQSPGSVRIQKLRFYGF